MRKRQGCVLIMPMTFLVPPGCFPASLPCCHLLHPPHAPPLPNAMSQQHLDVFLSTVTSSSWQDQVLETQEASSGKYFNKTDSSNIVLEGKENSATNLSAPCWERWEEGLGGRSQHLVVFVEGGSWWHTWTQDLPTVACLDSLFFTSAGDIYQSVLGS